MVFKILDALDRFLIIVILVQKRCKIILRNWGVFN